MRVTQHPDDGADDRAGDRSPDGAGDGADDVRRRDLHGPGARDARTGRGAAAARIHQQGRWVDLQIEQAMARGEFDDLPGAGKPIADLGGEHDPDWWLRKLVEREQVTGILPPALGLRSEDARLDDELDRLATAEEVRREVETFNERIRRARMQLTGGPPVVTPMRDVEAQVAAWEARRSARIAARRASAAVPPSPGRRERRGWLWRRRSGP